VVRGGVLLVEASEVGRQLLNLLLRPRFQRVIEARDCDEALTALATLGFFDVVLVDLEAPGDAEGLVSSLCEQPGAPAVLVTTRSSDLDLETRLTLRGVIGFLTKPIRAPALFRALRGLDRSLFVPVATQTVIHLPDVCAEALDPASETPVLRWEIRDISRGGALLLTHSSLAVGARLRLRLRLGDEPFEVTAEVVRVQDPVWAVLPGVAVRFLDLSEAGGRAIDGLRSNLAIPGRPQSL
jgi:CheY-like chemotaxis protein